MSQTTLSFSLTRSLSSAHAHTLKGDSASLLSQSKHKGKSPEKLIKYQAIPSLVTYRLIKMLLIALSCVLLEINK